MLRSNYPIIFFLGIQNEYSSACLLAICHLMVVTSLSQGLLNQLTEKKKKTNKQLQIKERGWGWLLHVRTLCICWNRLFSEWPLKHIILLPTLVSVETLQTWKQNKPHLQTLQDTWDPGLQTASTVLLSLGLCLTLMDRMVRSSPPQACQPPFVSPTSFLYWSWDTI